LSPESPNEEFALLESTFHRALVLPPEQREAFLHEASGENLELLRQLQSLLAAHLLEQQASERYQQAGSQQTIPLQRRLGPYEVESLLGRGGMGAVYLAHRADGQYEKKVAIKIVDLPLATEVFFDRFRQERQILAGLDHPNIARLLDGGVSDDGILFLVMEYVNGTPIDRFCETNGLPADARLRLFLPVCAAVQFAHQNLVVHRDLKPDNVLVSEDGVPHLLDFGTAKLISQDTTVQASGLTREGFLSFTPEYASPEQVLGRPVATTTDTYSLGVLLYRILTGKLPYRLNDFSAEEMIHIICDGSINRPTSTDGTFPNADLEAILEKSLRKEPDQRYPTAEQFATDIQAYLDDKPVLARRGNLQYRAAKYVRRHRLGIAFAAVLTITLVAGMAGVLWQAHLARLAERSSQASADDLSRLSDNLLSELDDTIKQLPGSTGAQQVLVGHVLEHLDRMAQDHRGSAVTQISLVHAFVRLSNLQANPYEQNLGDTAGALRNLDKALKIAEPLARSRPHDPDVLLALARAQDARGEILSVTSDIAGAAQSLQASVKTYEEVLATPAKSPALYFEAGDVIDTLGDVMGQDTGLADAAAALENYRRSIDFDHRALALDPSFTRARRGLITMQMKVGNVELDTAPAAALADFQASISRLDALPAADQSRLDLTRMRALLLRKQAFALSELGRYTECWLLYGQSDAIYRRIAAADPRDVRSRTDLVRLLNNETSSAETAMDPTLAPHERSAAARAKQLESIRADILRQAIQSNPHDATLTQESATVTILLDSLSNPGLELPRDRQALQLLRNAVADPKASPMLLDLAFQAFTHVKPESLRDNTLALRIAERGVVLTHRKAPSWLLSLAEAYQAQGRTAEAVATSKEGLALLPSDPADRNFRLRRLFEAQIASGSR
jgi:serine/threonine protein kinase